jgi:hypothetical protein
MVIAAAVGGRNSLLGAIYGSLLVNYGKTFFSESLPELWLFLLGGLFILVVMAFPNGLAGLDVRRWLGALGAAGKWKQKLAAQSLGSSALGGSLAGTALAVQTAAPSRPHSEVPQ